MKIFKFLAVALVAILGFAACDKETEHIYDVHSADLVGTWTCITDNYAEALIINADGSAVSYGVEDGEYWENVKGTVTVKENNITMIFEDDDNVTGHFDIIPGHAFSLFEESGERYIYQYCAKDLADEIVGMWVCNDTPNAQKNDIAIISYFENGTSTFTGMIPNAESYMVTANSSYKVVGDLLFQKNAEENSTLYLANRLVYTPNGTPFGDILTQKLYVNVENIRVETSMTYLRIKQTLELPGNRYDYKSTYVSNVKSKDMEFSVMGQEFSFANMNSSTFDAIMKTFLFSVEFPDKNTLNYSYNYYGVELPMSAPIAVKDNTMTIKMSECLPGLKDVMLYAFQDVDCSQLHLYMHRNAFVNFFTNMVAMMMTEGDEDFDIAETINLIHEQIDDAVVSINLSIVMTNPTKA